MPCAASLAQLAAIHARRNLAAFPQMVRSDEKRRRDFQLLEQRKGECVIVNPPVIKSDRDRLVALLSGRLDFVHQLTERDESIGAPAQLAQLKLKSLRRVSETPTVIPDSLGGARNRICGGDVMVK